MRKHNGFIDPISLISLGFLIVSLVITTAIIKNPDTNLDIRNWAALTSGRCSDGSMAPDGDTSYCPSTTTPKTTVASTAPAPVKTTAPTTTTPTTTSLSPTQTITEIKLCTMEGGTWSNNDCVWPGTTPKTTVASTAPAPVTTTTTPTTTTLSPTQTITERKFCTMEGGTWSNNDCVWPGTTPKTTVASTAPAPVTTTTTTTTSLSPTQTITEIKLCTMEGGTWSNNDCVWPGATTTPTPTLTTRCRDKAPASSCICKNGSWSCPTSTKTTTITTNIITIADCNECLAKNGGEAARRYECSGACNNVGKPITVDTCIPGCSGGGLITCSSTGTRGFRSCPNGCENGACKPELLATGEACSLDNQCGEGKGCYYTSPTSGNRICAGSQAGAAILADAKSLSNIASNPNTIIQAGLVAAIVALTMNPASTQYVQPLMQNVANIANLAQGPLAVGACMLYGNTDPRCLYGGLGVAAEYIGNPVAMTQSMTNSATQLLQPVNNYFNNALSGLDFSNPNAGTLGTYGGQTDRFYNPLTMRRSYAAQITSDMSSILDSPTIELSTGEIGSTYEELLYKVNFKVSEGSDPINAVIETVNKYNPRNGYAPDVSQFAYEITMPDTITGQLLCGTKPDCLGLPVLEQQLLSEFDIQSELILGKGGTRGNLNYPYTHGALLIEKDQILGYFAPKTVSTNLFQKYADGLKWGDYNLEFFDQNFNPLNEIAN